MFRTEHKFIAKSGLICMRKCYNINTSNLKIYTSMFYCVAMPSHLLYLEKGLWLELRCLLILISLWFPGIYANRSVYMVVHVNILSYNDISVKNLD